MNELIVHIAPMGKPRMTRRDRWAKRPAVLRYFAMKDELIRAAKEQGFDLGGSFLIEFYIPIPKSTPKKKAKEIDVTKHDRRPDLDNLLKGVMDALLEEDGSVHTVLAKKYWTSSAGMIYVRSLGHMAAEGAVYLNQNKE